MKPVTYYHVICLRGCPFCDDAVELLKELRIPYHAEYYDRGERLDEQKQHYGWETAPIINKVDVDEDGTITNRFIGGYTDLKEYMNIGTQNTKKAKKEKEQAASDT